MEIIFKTTDTQSNFNYCANLFKGKKVLNGFNRLSEELICEMVDSNEYSCQNVIFENKIDADLFICYPLQVVVKAGIKFQSLHELISEIRRVYKQIYAEEIKSMKRISKSKTKSRETTNGDFGIWGHDICDLVIESIKIVEGDTKPLVNVSIGS